MIFGRKIKELREERGLVQRQLSAALEIDTPMYSKIERGERKAKRCQIPIMAQMFEVDEKELLTIWLADKVLDTVEGEEDVSHDALVYAQKEMKGGRRGCESRCIGLCPKRNEGRSVSRSLIKRHIHGL